MRRLVTSRSIMFQSNALPRYGAGHFFPEAHVSLEHAAVSWAIAVWCPNISAPNQVISYGLATAVTAASGYGQGTLSSDHVAARSVFHSEQIYLRAAIPRSARGPGAVCPKRNQTR